MFSTSRILACTVITLGACATLITPLAARAETPHLTLDDIDQLSRDKVVRQLKGTPEGAPVASVPATPLSASLPSAPDASQTPKVVPKPAVIARSHAEPATFVGAYSDATGGYVLYEMDGGIYTAHLGKKLINGWIAQKVDGYLVTVAEGKRVWTETIRGEAAAASPSNPALQALNDLSSPLPPAGMMSSTPIRQLSGR
jgi:hypothetical protein